jgi:TnpA family transposase
MRPGPDIAPLAAQPIDEALIAGHWTDVIRLATSIRTGVTSASVMLERLGSYPRANGLALALREIGRVERTLFTLDWIERPEERRQATRELNKGEAQNALKRAIFFHRTGRIRDHGLQARDTAPAHSIWSPARSCCGTPPTLKPPCAISIGKAARCRPTCSSTSPRSGGSTSI